MRGVRYVALVAVFSIQLVAACAPRIAMQARSQLVAADAALLRGCYDCLIDAREIYRKLPVEGRADSAAAAAAWVFETDLLIALREKEIGLPASGTLTEARRIAMELPRELEAGRYVDLVEAIPGCELGASQGEVRAWCSARLPAMYALEPTATADARAWLLRGKLRKPVRDYLRIALDCIDPIVDENPPGAAHDASSSPSSTGATQPQATLLLRYRVAICKLDAISELGAIRASEPRFVEASLFMARAEIARLPFDGPRQAKVHLDEVLARFPASPAITYLAASYQQLVGDYAEALRLHERTLDLRPDHDPALLGRVISLSNLGRTRDAIDAATRLIAHGDAFRADAYYWRARDLHALGQLDDARRDVSAAKELSGSEDLLLLAGMIEYEQGDLDLAQADLAIVINNTGGRSCEAHWYLGLVDRQRKRWSSARHALEDAMTCYRQRARTTADELQSLQARSDLDPTYRGRAAASLEAAVAADTRQQHVAALDAAGIAAAGDDFAGARGLIDVAAGDPALADRVAKLRSWLDRSHRVSP
jgi:tetratricopeptide (TPR) repeat protein